MDKSTVKLLLESYRPHDAGDPIFAEALREVAADPDLAAWFEDMQRFDAVMASRFQQVPVPPEVKNHILLGYYGADPLDERRPWARIVWIGSIAAILVLALICWRLVVPSRKAGDALATQAISYTEQMPALQFVCFDPVVVAKWINEQPGAQRVGLTLSQPGKEMSMAMIGSSIVEWNGKPVVMICLQDGKRMAMLYILKPEDAGGIQIGETETIQKANWVVQTKRTNAFVQVLATKGQSQDLNFLSPL